MKVRHPKTKMIEIPERYQKVILAQPERGPKKYAWRSVLTEHEKKLRIMLSTRGAKTVHLQRKKSGLDFSVKGGKEHGIPIVVSWIKENGAACELQVKGVGLTQTSNSANFL